MGWNYRLMRHDKDGEITYAVHEVYYDKDGAVARWTDGPTGVLSDDRGGVLLVLAKMADAYGEPVLDVSTGKIVEPEIVVADTFVSVMKNIKDELEPAGSREAIS